MADNISEVENKNEKVAKWRTNSFRVAAFCQQMAYSESPQSFRKNVLEKLIAWKLIDDI